MGTELKKTLSWEIENLSKERYNKFGPFLNKRRLQMFLRVYPKGHRCCDCDHLSLYLVVANPKSLRTGWKRKASFRLVLWNQSGKELFRSPDHPDFAVDFKPKNQGVKKAYMNLLLGLIETLSKSPQSLSVTGLSNAQNELTELTEAGFKLDWLKTKLEMVSLEKKKPVSDRSSPVLQLEELHKQGRTYIRGCGVK